VLVAVAGAVMVAATAVVTGMATAASQPAASPFSPGAATPPPIVEDYTYPGAEQILRTRGITLLHGDGHIRLVDCPAILTGLIVVYSDTTLDTTGGGRYCFQVTGPTGVVTMRVPDAFQIKGDSHTVQAVVTVNDHTDTVSVAKNNWTGIGWGVGPDPAMLLQLTATP